VNRLAWGISVGFRDFGDEGELVEFKPLEGLDGPQRT
jgi:hypothetical protein